MNLSFLILCFCTFVGRSVMYKVYLVQLYSSKFIIVFLLLNVFVSTLGRIYSTLIKSFSMGLASYIFIIQLILSILMSFGYFYLTIISFLLASLLYGLQTASIFSIMNEITNKWNIHKYFKLIIVFIIILLVSFLTSFLLVSFLKIALAIIVNLFATVYFYLISKDSKDFILNNLFSDINRIYDIKYILSTICINFVVNAIFLVIYSEYNLILTFLLNQLFLLILMLQSFSYFMILLYNSHTFMFTKDFKLSLIFQCIKYIKQLESFFIYNKYLKTHLSEIRKSLRKTYLFETLDDLNVKRRAIVKYTVKQKFIRYISNIFS